MKKNYFLLVQSFKVLVICLIMFTALFSNATTCPNAITISGSITFPSSAITLSCGTTNDITGLGGSGGTACGSTSYMGGNEALYAYTPSSNISGFTVAYNGVSSVGITIFQGCPTTGGTCLTSIVSVASTKTTTAISLTAGTAYYIMFDTWPSPASPCPGTFVLNGTISSGCSGTPNAGTSSITSSVGCSGSTFTLSAASLTTGSSITFQWQSAVASAGPWANIITGTTSTLATSTTSTTYYRIISTCTTSALSATSSVISYSVNPNPTITMNSGSICSGSSFTITPSGGATYTYTGGSAIVSPTVNTTYTVTGTNTFGCIGSALSTVTVNARPIVSIMGSGAICSGSSYTLIPSGAFTYTYSSGSAIVSPTITTTYSVTGTNTLGCLSSNTATTTLTVNANPTITVNSCIICLGQNCEITPAGGISYTFATGSATVTPTTTTSYTVLGMSSAGCIGYAVSTVTVNPNPTVIALTSNTLICIGGSAVLTASTSATTFNWNTGATTMSISVSPTVTTTYTVNVTNASFCSSSAVVTVNVSTCTGIDELVANGVIIYPNPNKGIINITLSSELSKSATLEIYDAIGKLIVNEALSSELNTLNISNLSNGIYSFRVMNNNTMVKFGKLAKQ
jgi:hypothetical protein